MAMMLYLRRAILPQIQKGGDWGWGQRKREAKGNKRRKGKERERERRRESKPGSAIGVNFCLLSS